MNFFKKHETTIYAVIIFIIIITVGIFLGINDSKQEQKSLLNDHEEIEENPYSQEDEIITIDQLSSKSELIKNTIQEKPVVKYNWGYYYKPEQLTSQIIRIEKDIEIIKTKSKNYLYEYFNFPLWAQSANLDPLPICISRLKSEIDKIEEIINQIKPKKPITQANYDKIISYVLSENENEVLSLDNLTEKEKITIEEARESQKQTLKFRKENKESILEYQQKCDDYKKQINKLNPEDGYDEIKIEALNSMLSNAIKLRDSLQRQYDNDISGDPLENINSLYEITSNEG
ncbi:hypothetical protein [Candidatus Phytoplasma meliae]|uniref:Effector n=1 Tax=Candidatus Phytoplasma meliae TaxID=1848402 RepID=A0ABS5CZ18_9MOLU|nr:hypothetical protein [Candidatus Phytoplasma meliae]MBP5836228.1 hypothetical protein [Candidatus Phytoplasma meliae]